jgi:putative MFS transporter
MASDIIDGPFLIIDTDWQADPKGDVAMVAARIERLPFSRWHVRIFAIVGTAYFFDAFDALSIAFVLPILIGLWGLTPVEVGYVISAGYVGQLVGAYGFSWMAEQFGRREALKWSVWVISLCSLACGLSWSFGSFVMFRVIQGVGLGGEIPVAVTYMNEMTKASLRGRVIVLVGSAFAFGIMVVSFVALWVIPHLGWQALFYLGASPALLAILMRRLLPESPRWLANKGRLKEAEAIVSSIENQITGRGNVILPQPVIVASLPALRESTQWRELLSSEYFPRTFFISIVMLCTSLTGYGLLTWMPSIYRSVYKLPVEQTLQLSLLGTAAVLFGGLVNALLIDRFGRRPSFMFGFVASGISLMTLYCVAQTVSVEIVAALASTSLFFITFVLTGVNVYASEMYPTRIRALAAGLGGGWFRMGSIVGPTIIGTILTFASINGVFLFFALAAFLGALVVYFSFSETKGRVLEELSR